MSEFHDTGMTKQEHYSMDRHRVNQEFDAKLKNKSFFTSARSIQEEREQALKSVDDSYYGGRGGGFAME